MTEENKVSIADLEKRIASAEKKQAEMDVSNQNKVAAGAGVGGIAPISSVNSDEMRCLRSFGVGHASKLLDINVADDQHRHVPMELKHMVLELKRDVDICRMMQQRFHGEALDRGDSDLTGFSKVKGLLDNPYGRSVLAPKLKAFNTTADAEWVPTAVSSQFIAEYELERQVASQFKEISMPSNPYDMPVQGSTTEGRILGENSTMSEVQFDTDKITMSATKLAEFYALSEEINEDSAPAILALGRQEVTASIMRAIEQADINGDDSGTHQDNDTDGGAASLAAKAWKGLRKLGLANTANGADINFGAAVASTTNLRAMRTAMGKFGTNPRELVWVVSPKVYNQMLDLPEVTTVEKFGQQATILQGALAALDGIGIVISEFMRTDLADTGVNTVGGPNDFATALLVNKTRFFQGVRRPIRVRAVVNPTPPNDQWLLASWWRGDFQGHVQDADEVSVTVGRNIL